MLNIQKPGWVPELPRTLLAFFFELDRSVQALEDEIDLERLMDAARDAVCEGLSTFRFDPVEWDERDTGSVYHLALRPAGRHTACGLTGQLFEVRLKAKCAKTKEAADMPTFIIQCENLIVESGNLYVEADTAEEAMAFAQDPDNRQDLDYSFNDTAGSRYQVVGKEDEEGSQYFDEDEDDTDSDPDASTLSIQVYDFGYIAPYVLEVITGRD